MAQTPEGAWVPQGAAMPNRNGQLLSHETQQVLGPNGQPVQLQGPLQGVPLTEQQQLDAIQRPVDHDLQRGAANAYASQPSTDEALRQSMMSESALQGEVTILRERIMQVMQTANQERQALLAGVSQMLQPLMHVLRARGYQVLESQVVQLAVQLLTGNVLVPAPSSFVQHEAMPRWAEALHKKVEWLQEQVLRQAPPSPMPPSMLDTFNATQPQPAHYPTWILTDSNQARREQELLREQQARGGMAYGG